MTDPKQAQSSDLVFGGDASAEAESDIAQRFAFSRLEEDDLELLAGLRPLFESCADEFIEAFYAHLEEFEEPRRLFADPEVKSRLVRTQRDYLLGLCEPSCSRDFYEERRRIGEAHDRVGLAPRWYLGAYSFLLSFLAPKIIDDAGDDTARGLAAANAFQKVLLFDVTVAMEAYVERQRHELEQLNRKLASASRKLNLEFEHQGRELREAREWARSAEERVAMATLIAGLAHEIGTPMGVIQGHAKLLEPAVTGEDAKWRLETIQEQIGRITKIIQSLLKMSNPERRTRDAPVQLEAVLDITLSFLSENLSRNGIELTRNFAKAPVISGDSERLQQVFLNLFMNAVDAMPSGGSLSVSLAPVAGAVEVRVADTGLGISEQDQSRVFDPFFTTKPTGYGTGLGLMMVRTIVAEHGGEVELESSPGEGAEFFIRFPHMN
jgi:signal transduction histidine kinase